ncbi:MAG: 3-oxoacyl-ACP reductase [Jatrophihabitantaceae bacterium]
MASQSTDRYLALVNSPIGANVAAKVGLPRPAVLRRYRPDGPLLGGPLEVATIGAGLVGLTDLLAGLDVELAAPDSTARLGALLLDASDLAGPDQLAELRAKLAGSLRRLGPSARVLLIGRTPDGQSAWVDAGRQALDGIVRSLAKELRSGATANLIQLDAADTPLTNLAAPVRFLLSGRSAYVDGQVLRVGGGVAPAPGDWAAPLAGKTALVTGAARGIGAAIAEVLARDGASVVVADLPAAGQALAKVANRIGASTLQLDIAAPQAADTVAEYLTQRHGGVDIVIHNAGITRDKLLANMKPEVWDSVLAVNLLSQLRINEKLLDSATLREGGRVVCLASTSGIAGNRGQTNYAASKAGVIGMVRALAPAFAARQATINAVAPGFIDTEMTRAIPFVTREVARRLSSLQQAGLPVDVAETIAFLSQSAAGGVSGQVLRVCGQNLVGA